MEKSKIYFRHAHSIVDRDIELGIGFFEYIVQIHKIFFYCRNLDYSLAYSDDSFMYVII